MSDFRLSFDPPSGLRRAGLGGVVVVGAVLLAIGLIVPGVVTGAALISAAAALLMLAAMLAALLFLGPRTAEHRDTTLRDLLTHDDTPAFVTDGDGVLLWANDAARDAAGSDMRAATELLAPLTGAAAHPAETLARLLGDAGADGVAQERVGAARLHATAIGSDRVVWTVRSDSEGTNAEDPILRCDPDGSILWMSGAALDLFAGPPVRLSDIGLDGALDQGLPIQLETTDGSRTFTVRSRDIALGTVEVTLGPTDDLPETGDVASVPGRYTLDDLPVPILELHDDGTVARSNALAQHLLALGPEERVGLSTLVEGLGRQVNEWLADARAGRALNRPEVVRASRVAGDLFVQVTLTLAAPEHDRRIMALLHDATELKTLEAQFVQSQKMQAIGQLAGGVAHDFNNLLTAISGHCDLLLLRHDPGDQDFADLEQINQNANRAASLVGQLLAFSRKQTLRPEMLDMRDTLSDLSHLLNRLVGEKVTLSVRNDSDLKMVRADKRQLEQVIMNLVVNARDAMPEGGTVEVRAKTVRLDTPVTRDRVEMPAGAYVVVEVKDSGIGIPEDQLPKIFEPFYTTKRTGEGTGLGLSTAYGIVKQTGAYIFVQSEVGKGTMFSLYFPAHDGQADRSASAGAHVRAQPTDREARILLVEDEAPVRAFAARALRLRGHHVIEAENAERALDIAADGSLEIDIFVTDIIMPGRDGPSWVREALEERPDTGVIFVSGYAEESFSESQANIPNSTFLPKPFSLIDLTAAVDAHLER
ncbi:two-component system, cell cycle sensor histidine kinase and response regulator CckA [Palleronia salina]|uniref:histidine kinase n=1 Tax=Palleronia salina TaxID=313368 RepID=A0A1M6AS11_9RHOB|nr:ATP-binding protein [Palleronia salina]SHI39255.1 two-component system, cell cycle sensor histidine kinase and response regulator CckA [Palleronia salina]